MHQNNPKNEKIIKIVYENGVQAVPGAVPTAVQSFLLDPLYSMQVVPLEKPIPIPKSRKKKPK